MAARMHTSIILVNIYFGLYIDFYRRRIISEGAWLGHTFVLIMDEATRNAIRQGYPHRTDRH